MNDTFDNYRLTRLAFQAFGLWPYQKFRTRVIILTFVLFDYTSNPVPMVWYFIEEFSNTSEMVNCLPALFMLYVAFVSLLLGVANVNKVRNILHLTKTTWQNSTDSEEKILKKYAKKGGFMSNIIVGVGFAAGIVFTSLPLISKGLDSIFKPNVSRPMENILRVHFYSLDPKEHYLLINLHSFQIVWVIIMPTIMYGIYFLQLIYHACSMFAVLSHKIENVNRINCELREKMSIGELDQVLSSEIKTCISYHSECIRFVQLVDDSIKYLWLMRFFVDATLITVTAVQTIVNFGEPIIMLSAALNTNGIIFLLFFMTWASQQLLDHSNQLRELIYDIDWYEFPPRSKKLIYIMLMKSGTPCKMTAGGMIDLNLETFCRFMKLSTSYFTLVLSTQ